MVKQLSKIFFFFLFFVLFLNNLFERFIINLNDLNELLINPINPSLMTDTLNESIFCRLPNNDDKLPLKIKPTLNDSRQVFEVADVDVINKFISSSSQETKFYLQIIIPYLLLYLPDQKFLNNIYNR